MLLVLLVAAVFVSAGVAYAASYMMSTNLETTSLSVTSSSSTQSSGSSSSGLSSSAIEGIVTGYVTASPSQPTCTAGQNCDENMTGYSVVFTLQCTGSTCPSAMAPLNPAGHYSILLPPGSYLVTGLSPKCPWTGCSTAFPQSVAVVGGMQIELNVEIDTGIR